MAEGRDTGGGWNVGRFARTVAIFIVLGPLIGLAVAVAWTFVAEAGQMLEPVRSADWKAPSLTGAAGGVLLIGGVFFIGAMLFGAVPALAAGVVAGTMRELGVGRWARCLASAAAGALVAWMMHRTVGEFGIIAPVAAIVAAVVCTLATSGARPSEARKA